MKIILFSISLCVFSQFLFAMEAENNEQLPNIVIKKNISREEFFEKVKGHIPGHFSMLSGGGGAMWSYNVNKINSFQLDHKVFEGDKILIVYAINKNGEQKVFIGEPSILFAFKKFMLDPVLTVAVLQSSENKFQFIDPEKKDVEKRLVEKIVNAEGFFSEITSRFNIPNVKTYWVKVPDEKMQLTAAILKGENQSFLLLQDGQTINFHH